MGSDEAAHQSAVHSPAVAPKGCGPRRRKGPFPWCGGDRVPHTVLGLPCLSRVPMPSPLQISPCRGNQPQPACVTCLQERTPFEGPGLGDPFRPSEWLVELTDLALRGQTGDSPLSSGWVVLMPVSPQRWAHTLASPSPGLVGGGSPQESPRTSMNRVGECGLRGSALAVSPGDKAWFLKGEASRGLHISEAGFKSSSEQIVNRSEFSSKWILLEESVKGFMLQIKSF